MSIVLWLHRSVRTWYCLSCLLYRGFTIDAPAFDAPALCIIINTSQNRPSMYFVQGVGISTSLYAPLYGEIFWVHYNAMWGKHFLYSTGVIL